MKSTEIDLKFKEMSLLEVSIFLVLSFQSINRLIIYTFFNEQVQNFFISFIGLNIYLSDTLR